MEYLDLSSIVIHLEGYLDTARCEWSDYISETFDNLNENIYKYMSNIYQHYSNINDACQVINDNYNEDKIDDQLHMLSAEIEDL